MSQWTHVSGCIRVDAIPEMMLTPDLVAILGTPSVLTDSEFSAGWDIPGGSEGTIQYAISHAGNGMVWKTVAVWGDLRDFGVEDCPEIDAWFARVVAASHPDQIRASRLMLRAAHLLIDVESGPRYLLVAEDMPSVVRRIDL